MIKHKHWHWLAWWAWCSFMLSVYPSWSGSTLPGRRLGRVMKYCHPQEPIIQDPQVLLD